jgi:hypothetical protein
MGDIPRWHIRMVTIKATGRIMGAGSADAANE